MFRLSTFNLLLTVLFILYGHKITFSAEFGESTVNRDLLTVVTLEDDGTVRENDTSKYDFQLKGQLKNQPEYNFKSGSKCVGVKYCGAEVWVYDYNKKQKYPKSVKLDPGCKTLWVQLDKFDFYTFQFTELGWVLNTEVSSGSGKSYDENLSLMGLFENHLTSTTTTDHVKHEEETETKETKDEQRLSLNLGEQKRESEHPGTSESDVSCSRKERRFSYDVSEPSTPTVEAEKPKEPEPVAAPPKLVVVDLNTKESTDDFDYSFVSDTHTYTAKAGVLFNKVVEGPHELFELHDSQLSHKVEVDVVVKGKLRLKFTSENRSFLFRVNDPNYKESLTPKVVEEKSEPEPSTTVTTEPEPSTTVTTEPEPSTTVTTEPEPSTTVTTEPEPSTTVTTEPEPSTTVTTEPEPSTTVTTEPVTPKEPETSTPAPKLVPVDLLTKESTDDFDYSFVSDTHTYTAKAGVLFNKVVKGPHGLFELDDSQSSQKVEVDESVTGKLRLKFTSENRSFLFRVNDPNYKESLTPKVVEEKSEPEPSTTVTTEPEPSTTVTTEPVTPKEPETSTPAPKLVVVDLNTKESTDDFDYSFVSDKHTYTAKTGVKFNKVVKAGDSLWESSDSRYLVKLDADFTDLGKVMLSLYYDLSGSHELHVAKDPHPDPLSTPSDASRVTLDPKSEVLSDHLKVLTLNDDGSSVEDKSRFDLEGVTNLFNYKFKEGSKCSELKYDNVTVWAHDPEHHEDKYPTSVLLNTQNNFLFVESTGYYQYSYSFYNNKWNQVSGYKPKAPEKLDPNKLELETLNRDGTTTKNDSAGYERRDVAGSSVFRFNRGVKCVLVRYHGHTLWKHSEEEFGTDFPTSVTLNSDKSYVMVDSGTKYRYMFSYHKKWKQELGYKSTLSKPLEFDKLTVVTLEDDETTKENDATKYTRKDSPVHSDYKFNKGTKCTEVKYDGVTVWKYNVDEHSNDYPLSLNLNKTRSTLLVDSVPNYRYLFGFYNNEWSRLPFGYTSKKVKKEPTTTEPFKATPDKLTVVTLEDDGSTKENDESKYQKEDSSALFTLMLNDGTKCTELKYDGESVWKHDQNEHGGSYPKSLALNKNNNLLMVNSDDYQFYYSYYNETWNSVLSYKTKKKSQVSSDSEPSTPTVEAEKPKEPEAATTVTTEPETSKEPGPVAAAPTVEPEQPKEPETSTPAPKLVPVDLLTKESTDDFDYSFVSDKHTYTAKTGVKFNKVVKGPHELFELDDSQSSQKVEVDESVAGKLRLKFTFEDGSFLFTVDDPTHNGQEASTPFQTAETTEPVSPSVHEPSFRGLLPN